MKIPVEKLKEKEKLKQPEKRDFSRTREIPKKINKINLKKTKKKDMVCTWHDPACWKKVKNYKNTKNR